MESFQKTQEFITGNVPSYTEAFYSIKSGFERCHVHCNESSSYHPLEFFGNLPKFSFVNWKDDLGIVGLMAVVWTLMRYLVANLISKVNESFSYSLPYIHLHIVH